MYSHASLNRFYRLVRNRSTGLMMVAPETARGGGAGRSAGPAASLALVLLFGAPASWALDPGALPVGGQVTAGSSSIAGSGNTLNVNQASQCAIINWQSFDIGSAATVNFAQPSVSAVALNRVNGTGVSQIFGNLNANGQVYLVNPSGILFGAGAQVNVGGLVASTLGISDGDFLAGRDTFTLDAGNNANASASVVNHGALRAADGGRVVLLGATVSNTGQITAQAGNVALAAGQQVRLAVGANGHLQLGIDAAQVATLVSNGGLIQADGGQIVLSAQGQNALAAAVVSNTGTLQARTVASQEGKILLLADLDHGGTALVDGLLDASASQGGNGGFIETSGQKVKVAEGARITTLAAQGNGGKSGTWLIDPTDFTIAASGGDMTGTTLSNNLATTSVVIESVNGANGVNGDVNVNTAVSWNAATSLTLNAVNNININAPITVQHAGGGLALVYGGSDYNIKAPVSFNAGSGGSFSVNGQAYTLVHSMSDLEDMNGNLGGFYALATDLSVIGGSHRGALVGNYASRFTGRLAGLGHVIDGLELRGADGGGTGLFGAIGNTGQVRDFGLTGVQMTGSTFGTFGALAGYNYGSITNAYASGSVSGEDSVGGLVGNNQGSISNSYASGSVSGSSTVGGLVGRNNGGSITNSYANSSVSGSGTVGGLVGVNTDGGNISNSYASGSVSGSSYVGGLVGVQVNLGSISNSYASGRVSGASETGGLVGGNSFLTVSGSISNSYWDSYSTGQAAAVGTNTGTLTNVNAFTSDPAQSAAADYAFKASTYAHLDPSVWYLADGLRPMLRSEYSTTINNAHQLQLMAMDLTAAYTLGRDIDATATNGSNRSDVWDSTGFRSVGNNSTTRFTGSLDGQSHVIDGLSITAVNNNGTGLFGAVGSGGQVRDLGLTGVNIVGGSYNHIGALASFNYGSISNAYASGNVSGQIYVGGLVGVNGSSITNSYASGSVSGANQVGGLVGYHNNGGSISNTYASGSVSGTRYVGGLVGLNGGSISNTYASGSVSGTNDVGGLIGANTGIINNSYWDSHSTVQAMAVATNTGTLTNVSAVTSDPTQSAAANYAFKASAYAGWDLATVGGSSSVWRIYEGSSAPLLRSFLKPLTVAATGTVSRSYDGTAIASGLSYTASGPAVVDPALILGTASYRASSKNVGTYTGQNLISAGLYSGQQGYDISYAAATGSLTITPLALTGSITAANKVYNATTGATTSGTLTGVLGADRVSLATSGSFLDKNAANGKTVNVSGSLAGADAGNYTLASNATTTADITPLALTGSITAANKVYNATTDATTSGTLTGVLGADSVSLATSGSFLDKNAANGKTVNVSGSLAGADAGNYTLASNATTTADITPTRLIIMANDAAKPWDGQAYVGGNGVSYSGFVAGEGVAVLGGALVYGGSAQGATSPGNHVLSVSGLTSGNYSLQYRSGILSIAAPVNSPAAGQIDLKAQTTVSSQSSSPVGQGQGAGPLHIAVNYLRVD